MSQHEIRAKRAARKPAPAILADPDGGDQAAQVTPAFASEALPGIALADAALSTVPAAADVAGHAADEMKNMTEQAGAVAAEVIEPVVEATTEAITAVNEAAPEIEAEPRSVAPLPQLLKGLSMATAYETNPTQMFAGMNDKAKDAMEKGVKFAEDFSDFTKGNVEALVASSRIAAKGVEEIAQSSADYSRKSVEHATAAMKSFAAVKSPTELLQLQSDYARSAVDSMVAETSKFTESYLKLMGEITQPLTSRYAIAAERIKAVAA